MFPFCNSRLGVRVGVMLYYWPWFGNTRAKYETGAFFPLFQDRSFRFARDRVHGEWSIHRKRTKLTSIGLASICGNWTFFSQASPIKSTRRCGLFLVVFTWICIYISTSEMFTRLISVVCTVARWESVCSNLPQLGIWFAHEVPEYFDVVHTWVVRVANILPTRQCV